MAMAHEAQALGMARVYWHGAHTAQIVNSPLGKLHSEGLALLRAHSWECVPASDPRVPGFAFTTRKGADFPATGPGLPRVRQFPQRCTAVLDDKARLAQCLEAAGCASIAPRTWTDLDAFLAQHSSSGSVSRSAVGGGSGSSMAAQPAASGSQLYFLKHRHGVKGQAVYPFTSLPSLLDRLRSLGGGQQGTSQPSCSQQGSGQEGSMQQGSGQEGSMQQSSSGGQPGGSSSQEGSGGPRSSGASSERRRNQQAASHSGGSRQHFVVQEGVEAPLLLPDGRKFTLRAHVLMLLEHSDCHAAGSMAQQAQPGHHGQEQQLGAQEQLQRQPQKERPKQQAPRLRAWVHEDVIVTPHAAPLAAGGPAAGAAGAAGIADVAVHVSSRGRGHPKPFLLNQLGLELQQERQQPESQPALPGEPSEQRPPSIGATQLQQELWRQICSISRAAVAAGAQHRLVPSRADPQAVLYHLWAFDFAVAAGEPPADVAATLAASQQVAGEACKAGYAAEGEGQQAQAPHLPPRQPRVLLLEANSYPAIASGTMAAVPRALYTRLIGDLLTLVVLPALGNGGERAGEGAAGGFVLWAAREPWRAPAFVAHTEGPKLLDLPCVLLEIILVLLPLKSCRRFSNTCRAARQLVSSSQCLFPEVSPICRSRTQTLALLRWLGSGGRGTRALFLRFSVQRVPIGHQLGQGIGMQGALLEALLLRSVDGPLVLDGDWLSSLVRLGALTIQACAVELGSSCGQLAALWDLAVQNGSQVPDQELYARSFSFMEPGTVAVQPGAIPAGLTSMTFSVCAMPELPSALCAATGLKELRLEHCPQSFGRSSWNAAALIEGTIGCFTALETLQLRLLRLQDQPHLPTLLAGLTRLQHLDLTESLLCDGGEQALCRALPQLSSLTSLSLGSLTSPGGVQAEADALPNLLELRGVLPEVLQDQSLQLVAAAPRLQSLMVGAGSLLRNNHNLQLLRELPDLRNLAVVLPTRDSTWEELDESWVARLMDAIVSLPALDYVLLLFGDDEMAKEPPFYGLDCDLFEHGGQVAVSLSASTQLKELDTFWPPRDGFAQRFRQLLEARLLTFE